MYDSLEKSRFMFLWVVGLLATTAGCGNGNLVSVEGNITVAGKPADDGAITFAPVDGNGPSVGGTIKDGKYQLAGTSGVTPGPKTVHITALLKTGKQIEAGPPMPKGTTVDQKDRFSADETCTVATDPINQRDFDLKPQQSK